MIAHACQSENHVPEHDAADVLDCDLCGKWFCGVCEGGADGYSELCDDCFVFVVGSDYGIHDEDDAQLQAEMLRLMFALEERV